MNPLVRCLSAFAVLAILVISPIVGPAAGAEQPRTPCDQLVDRLTEIQAQEAQLRAEYAAAAGMPDPAGVGSMIDRLGTVLTDTEALLQRIDECSRSPVPSMAD